MLRVRLEFLLLVKWLSCQIYDATSSVICWTSKLRVNQSDSYIYQYRRWVGEKSTLFRFSLAMLRWVLKVIFVWERTEKSY